MIKAEKPTFFIDRALGRKYVADALRNAGAKVEIHEDHFSPDSPDTEWLPEVSQRGWLSFFCHSPKTFAISGF